MIDILFRGFVGLFAGAIFTFLIVLALSLSSSAIDNYKRKIASKLETVLFFCMAIILACIAVFILAVTINFFLGA